MKKYKKRMLSLIENDESAFKLVHKDAMDDEFVINALSKNENVITLLDSHHAKSPKIISTVLSRNGLLLSDVHDDLKKDVEVISIAINNNINALQFVDKDIRNTNSEIAWMAVKKNGHALMYLGDKFKNLDDLAFFAITNGGSLVDIGSNLKNDRAFILKVVSHNGLWIGFFPDKWKSDKEVVLCAIKKSTYAYTYIDSSLTSDRKFIIEAVSVNGNIYKLLSPEFRKDKEIAQIALGTNRSVLKYVEGNLIGDIELSILSVSKYPLSLRWVAHQTDEIVDIAVSVCPCALIYAESEYCTKRIQGTTRAFIDGIQSNRRLNQDGSNIPWDKESCEEFVNKFIRSCYIGTDEPPHKKKK